MALTSACALPCPIVGLEMQATLAAALLDRATTHPDEPAWHFAHGGAVTATWTWSEAERRARAVATELSRRGLRGERVLLLFAPGLDFVAALYGCFLAGVVAVPCYPPEPLRLERTLPRTAAIAATADVAAGLTTGALLTMGEAMFEAAPTLRDVPWIASDELDVAEDVTLPSADDVALLQFTSGSTGTPRGIVLRHRHLMANVTMMQRATGHDERCRIVSWLPVYHDLGLVCGVLYPASVGAEVTMMSPLEFLGDPMSWLETIAAQGADATACPNFALDLVVRRSEPKRVEALDLSKLRMVLVGGEPIRAATLDRFDATFAPQGFDRRAYFQGWGLAEAVVAASCGRLDAEHEVAQVDEDALARGEVARVDGGRPIVSCGEVMHPLEVRIVDPATRRERGGVGEIWLAGPTVGDGYWREPEATAATFEARLANDPQAGPFLRTGDLGFVDGGELFVTGRHKDLIIVRGRNVWPHDVEDVAAAADPAVRPVAAAFPVIGPAGEGLGVAVEARRADVDGESVALAVREAVTDTLQVEPERVVVLPPGGVRKTSSGKVRRRATRDALDGALYDWRAVEATSVPPLDVGALKAAPHEERVAELVAWMQARVAEALRTGALPDPDDELAALGLSSLTAMELIGGLSSALGEDIPTGVFFQHPTIAGLASWLGKRLVEGSLHDLYAFHAGADVLVPLQPEGDRPPLIVAHAIDGSPFPYFPFARELATRGQPVWAFSAPGLDGKRAPHSDLSAQIDEYVDAVVAARGTRWAHDRVRLGGWCFGGIIGHEVARRLEERGVPVEGLVLLDAPAPTRERQRNLGADPEDRVSAAIGMLGFVGRRFDVPVPIEAAYLRTLSEEEQDQMMLDFGRMVGAAVDSTPRWFVRGMVEVYRGHLRGLPGWRLTPWSGRVVGVVATEEPQFLADEWSPACGELRLVEAAGNHQRMMDADAIAQWAPHLLAAMDAWTPSLSRSA